MARTPNQTPTSPAVTPAATPPAKAAGANVPTTQAKAPPAVQTLNRLLESPEARKQIARACGKHLDPDRLTRVAVTAVQRVPKLLQCDPASIVSCVIQAAELNLELAGALGQAYMVPFWNSKTRRVEAQFQPGYKGLLALAHRSGMVKHVAAHEVYGNDDFAFEYGAHPRLIHRPAMRNRGEVIAYYATLTTTLGGDDFEVMSKEDVERHRDKFSKAADNGPWVTNFDEMGKKTVLKKLLKRAPMSVEASKAVALAEYGEAGIDQGLPHVEISTQERASALRDELARRQGLAEEPAALIEHQTPADAPDAGEHDPRAEDPVVPREQLVSQLEGMLQTAGWDEARVADHFDQAFGLKDTTDLAKLTDEQLLTWLSYMELRGGK